MLKTLIRDWWRGFTNDDLAAALRKTETNTIPGDVVWLSDAEFKAWAAFARLHGPRRRVEVCAENPSKEPTP